MASPAALRGVAGVTMRGVGAGVAGAVIVRRTDALSLPGNRGREQLIRRFAPKAAVLALVLLINLLAGRLAASVTKGRQA